MATSPDGAGGSSPAATPPAAEVGTAGRIGAWAEKIGLPLALTLLTLFGSFWILTAEQREQREQADRDSRTEAYKALLLAADDYATRYSTLNGCLLQRPLAQPQGGPIPPDCRQAFDDVLSARTTFDAATIDVGTYGSRSADEVVDVWHSAFPGLAGESYVSGSENLDPPTEGVTAVSIPWLPGVHTQQRTVFLRVMCQELPAVSRDNC